MLKRIFELSTGNHFYYEPINIELKETCKTDASPVDKFYNAELKPQL
jgi:hypothetical protein